MVDSNALADKWVLEYSMKEKSYDWDNYYYTNDIDSLPQEALDQLIATEQTDDDWLFITSPQELLPPEPKKPKMGRPSIVSKNPEVLTTIQNMITQNSAAAHSRRRDDTALSFGTSLRQLQAAVLETNNVHMSRNTIHRTMNPPNKTHNSARYYTSKINARVPRVSNCLTTKDHLDFRYTCVQVNTVNEMASLYEDEVLSLSCDDKNKVNIGTASVSRHNRYQAFFDTNRMPDLPDHDFPYRNSKLTPSGYLVLKGTSKARRSRSASPPRQKTGSIRRRSLSPPKRLPAQLTTDSCGRQRVVWPRGGPLHMFLHSDKYFPSTSQMHLNHLLTLVPPLLQSGKTVLTIICDGGPDWRTDSPANIINYGRLWRDLELDCFILTSYSPYHSRYNPVERGFSYLTKWLAGITLPICLPGEDKPPCEQNIPRSEQERKEKQVHENAMSMCANVWSGREWGGFPITAEPVPCDGSTLKYRDHSELSKLTTASLTSLRGELKELREEYKFFAKHLTRKTYQLEFTKCREISCGHCKDRPVKATKVMSYIRSNGGTIPIPTWSSTEKSHYRTFLDTLSDTPDVPKILTEHLPSGIVRGCKEEKCRYIPATETDRKRHNRLVHRVL